jgi:hypothetical protein
MKNTGLFVTILLLAQFSCIEAFATNIRGMLTDNDSNPYVKAKVYLSLTKADSDTKIENIRYAAETGKSGMYFFYKVDAGTYFLIIKTIDDSIIQFNIRVPALVQDDSEYFDIKAINVPLSVQLKTISQEDKLFSSYTIDESILKLKKDKRYGEIDLKDVKLKDLKKKIESVMKE